MIDVPRIKRLSLDARIDFMKTKNPTAETKALLLSSFVGDLEKIEKTHKRQVTEIEIVALSKQYLKNLNEVEKVAGVSEKTTIEKQTLETFLPPQKTEDELNSLIENIIQRVSASTIKEFGKVMSTLKNEAEGTYDNEIVARMIKSKLQPGA